MATRMTTRVKLGAKSPKQQIDHAQRDHAFLSASGSHRWINCTPSAHLEDLEGPRPNSVFAQEGTLAHEISELYIRRDIIGNISEDEFNTSLDEFMSNELFNEEMLDYVQTYVGYCEDEYNEANKVMNGQAVIEIEAKLNLQEWVPESFGSVDCCIIADGTLEVIDLKYGKGVPVYAPMNSQLMLYALGALRNYDTLYDIDNVKLTIVQPRLNNISTWETSVEELLKWAVEVVKPAADKAFKGEGELHSGDWCKFCCVKNKCRAIYEEQLKIAKYEFASPEFLNDEEIADILTRAPKFKEWIDAVCEYAQSKALNENKIWPGFKLVAGISRRKWIDDEEKVAEVILANFPAVSEDQIFDMKLKTITNVEKLVGKKAATELLGDVIIKPEGKPTLVPESDKRPALGNEDAINDFK